MRNIDGKIWSQKWFFKLSQEEKLLYLYFITSDHTDDLGIYQASQEYIPLETQIENYKDLLRGDLSSKIFYSEELDLIFIRDINQYSFGKSKDYRKSIYNKLMSLEENIRNILLKESKYLLDIYKEFSQEGEIEGVKDKEETVVGGSNEGVVEGEETVGGGCRDGVEKVPEKEKEKQYPPLIGEVENTYIGEEEPSEKQENISLAVKEKEKEKESSPITPKEKEKEKENILSPQEKEKEREIKDISYEISLACESQANYTESEILDEILKTSEGDDSKPTKKLLPNKKILPPEPDIRVPYKKIMALYNEICGATFHKVEFLSPQRRYTLQKLYKNFGGLERFRTLFEKAKASPFLRGENKSGWRANFDWILEHAYDILEGKYDEAKPEGYLPEMESIPILDLKRYVSDEYLQLWRELVKAEQGFETGEIFEFDQSVIEEYKQDIELFKTKHKLEKVADFPKRREAYLFVYEKRKNEEKYVVGR